MDKKNIMDEWNDAWPATVTCLASLIAAVLVAGFITLVIGQIFGWSDRMWFMATGVGTFAFFPVWLNRAMRSHYARESSDEVMRGRRYAYASGVEDQKRGTVGQIEPEIAAEVMADKDARDARR